MNKVILLLVVILSACGQKHGASTSENDRSNSTHNEDQLIRGTSQSVPADFAAFFAKFTSDSIFQLGHVNFPHRIMMQDDEGNSSVEEVSKDQWTFSSFAYDSTTAPMQVDAYTQELKDYGDTIKLELRGIDNGIHVDYNFVKENSEWFLVSTKDYSD